MKSLNSFASLELTNTEDVKGGTFFSTCTPKPTTCTPPPTCNTGGYGGNSCTPPPVACTPPPVCQPINICIPKITISFGCFSFCF